MTYALTTYAVNYPASTSGVDSEAVWWDWPIFVENDDRRVFYTRPGDHWKDARSNVRHARATFRFYGDRVRVYLPTSRDSGYVRIYLDGIVEAELDLFNIIGYEIIQDFLDLEPRLHEVQLVPLGKSNPSSSGQYVEVGRFAYRVPVAVEDQGEEIRELSWTSKTASA